MILCKQWINIEVINVTNWKLKNQEMGAEEIGVRGKLDLMSNIFTIMRIILWMEPAREIHTIYISKHAFPLFYYFSYFIILVILLFPYMENY